MINFLGFLKRKVFSSVKQSASLLAEGFKGLRFWLSMLDFSGDVSIFSIEWEQKVSEQHILTCINHF